MPPWSTRYCARRERGAAIGIPDLGRKILLRERDLARKRLTPICQVIDFAPVHSSVLKTELCGIGKPTNRTRLIDGRSPAPVAKVFHLSTLRDFLKTRSEPLDLLGPGLRYPQDRPFVRQRVATDEDRAFLDQFEDAAGLADRSHVADQYQLRHM